MSRIIKFRAWSKHAVSMQYRTLKEFQDKGFGLPVGSEETKIMQFTGLLDKNGKEIYEGDIVMNYYTGKTGALPDTENSFTIGHEKAVPKKEVWNDIRKVGIWEGADREYFEVIGNIYENPDLIK